MGMGEPLLNTKAVFAALEALADARRFGLGARRITVSTAGIVPGIRALVSQAVHPHLALSLNSPFDEERSRLMPVHRQHPLPHVLAACIEYAQVARRRVFLEYVLIGGTNTSARHAEATAGIARKLGAAVKLIPLNQVAGSGFATPTEAEVRRFREVLEGRGVTVAQRFRRGVDIGAGCGQLRGRHRGR